MVTVTCVILLKIKHWVTSPVVRTSPSSAEGTSLIPGGEAKISHASQPKIQNINNRNNIVTHSIKTLKLVHLRKKILKNENFGWLIITYCTSPMLYTYEVLPCMNRPTVAVLNCQESFLINPDA